MDQARIIFPIEVRWHWLLNSPYNTNPTIDHAKVNRPVNITPNPKGAVWTNPVSPRDLAITRQTIPIKNKVAAMLVNPPTSKNVFGDRWPKPSQLIDLLNPITRAAISTAIDKVAQIITNIIAAAPLSTFNPVFNIMTLAGGL